MSKLLSICMVLLVGCSSLATPTPTYYPDLSIKFGQWFAFDSSSSYALEIDANGNVRYSKWQPGAGVMERTSKITHAQVQELVDAIQKADIFAMEDVRLRMTMEAGKSISVTLQGKSRYIEYASPYTTCGAYHSAGRPTALFDLECTIKTIVNVNP